MNLSVPQGITLQAEVITLVIVTIAEVRVKPLYVLHIVSLAIVGDREGRGKTTTIIIIVITTAATGG
jgi:hypothetical protein